MEHYVYFYVEFRRESDKPFFYPLDREDCLDEYTFGELHCIHTVARLGIDIDTVWEYHRLKAFTEADWSFDMPLDDEFKQIAEIEEYWREQIVSVLGDALYRRLPLLTMYSREM